MAIVAALALLTAGAGTYVTVQVLRGDSSARAAAAMQRAAAPVMSALPAPLRAAPAKMGALAGELRGHVGPAGVRKIRKTLDEHNPALLHRIARFPFVPSLKRDLLGKLGATK